MGTHIYFNPGPRKTETRTNFGGTISIPPTTDVELHDGTDHIQLSFTDLDTLDEMVKLFEQARAALVAALLEGKCEMVHADQLAPEDLAVVDGELVMVDTVVLTGEHAIVRYARKYAGMYDLTADRSMTVLRKLVVKRLVEGATLAVVR